ncbi:TetR/AcrR family transcriptional regulator [Tsukamurella soli]|uniref:TetR/AcrR family transcriptional regulator n=1 Tax=Tsukamurella soli TaxID=644556 RepID=A0ABP8J2P6_9ACTN
MTGEPTTPTTPYHRGDVPKSMIRAGIALLDEEGGATSLSLRAAARRAGVSAAAPYRHFEDRTSFLSAIATVGYRELIVALERAQRSSPSPDDLADVAVAYVRFALDRPGLFRVMFAEPCDPSDCDRQRAADALEDYLHHLVQRFAPDADPGATATATWAMVHGLAFLHLDGKYAHSSLSELEARVRGAVRAAIGSRPVARDHLRSRY